MDRKDKMFAVKNPGTKPDKGNSGLGEGNSAIGGSSDSDEVLKSLFKDCADCQYLKEERTPGNFTNVTRRGLARMSIIRREELRCVSPGVELDGFPDGLDGRTLYIVTDRMGQEEVKDTPYPIAAAVNVDRKCSYFEPK